MVKVDDDGWKDSLQGYYDGCQRATSKYRGKAHDLADTLMKSFEAYVTKLIYFSNSNSTILSSSSKAILKSISWLNKLDQSTMQFVEETGKVFPGVVNDLHAVALSLPDHIGNLSDFFKDAVDDLSRAYSRYIKDILLSCRLFGCARKVDFAPTLKKCQKVMNIVALIAETLLKEPEANVEEHEAVLVLTLFWWLSIAVVLPISKIVRDVLAVVVNITMALNSAVKDILGIFQGVTITVADISRNLSKNLKGRKGKD